MELPKKQTIALSKTPIIQVSLTANPFPPLCTHTHRHTDIHTVTVTVTVTITVTVSHSQ